MSVNICTQLITSVLALRLSLYTHFPYLFQELILVMGVCEKQIRSVFADRWRRQLVREVGTGPKGWTIFMLRLIVKFLSVFVTHTAKLLSSAWRHVEGERITYQRAGKEVKAGWNRWKWKQHILNIQMAEYNIKINSQDSVQNKTFYTSRYKQLTTFTSTHLTKLWVIVELIYRLCLHRVIKKY